MRPAKLVFAKCLERLLVNRLLQSKAANLFNEAVGDLFAGKCTISSKHESSTLVEIGTCKHDLLSSRFGKTYLTPSHQHNTQKEDTSRNGLDVSETPLRKALYSRERRKQ
jgi:hypothetical protein